MGSLSVCSLSYLLPFICFSLCLLPPLDAQIASTVKARLCPRFRAPRLNEQLNASINEELMPSTESHLSQRTHKPKPHNAASVLCKCSRKLFTYFPVFFFFFFTAKLFNQFFIRTTIRFLCFAHRLIVPSIFSSFFMLDNNSLHPAS